MVTTQKVPNFTNNIIILINIFKLFYFMHLENINSKND